MLRAFAALAAVLSVTGAGAGGAAAELLSSRPITIVIPFTPGASSDTLQRIVDKKVSENTGQTLVVESRPGGSGVIAAAVVKQATAGRAHSPPGERGNSCVQYLALRNTSLQPDQGF